MGKQITLAELGRMLGLDKSSVSLALRGSPKVSQQTRLRVQAAASRCGYKPNLAARHLRCGGPRSVCLLLPVDMGPLAHSEPAATIRLLSELAARGGLLFTVFSGDRFESIFDSGSSLPLLPDGMFIWGNVSAEVAAACAAAEIPHVILDPNHASYADYTGPQVCIDNRSGSAALTGHLLERGARRLLFVQTARDHLGHDQRWQAARERWLACRQEQSLAFRYIDELRDEDLRQLARQGGGAIQCSNDDGAVHITRRLGQLEIQVPRDVLLAGFDGSQIAAQIGLTTAIFDAVRLAECGWQVLRDQMEHKADAPMTRTVPAALRIGTTT